MNRMSVADMQVWVVQMLFELGSLQVHMDTFVYKKHLGTCNSNRLKF